MVNKKNKAVMFSALSCAYLGSTLLFAALSADSSPVSAATPAPRSTVTLQGSATITAGQAENFVQESATEMKHLRHSAGDVIGEVERRNMAVASQPNVIGSMVIPAVPFPSGMIGIGPNLPPRRKFLNLFVSQMAQYYNLCNADVHKLVVPEDRQEEITPLWNQATMILQDMSMHYMRLAGLIEKDKLDSVPIGREALSIYDDTIAFDKPWKEISKILKTKH